jgi:MOSC domain-containing protein
VLPQTTLPRLTRIQLHPIKSLDPIEVQESRIGPAGGLEHDRAWALFSVDGRWVNGKRAPALHLIRAVYAADLRSVTLSVPGDRRKIPTRTFVFPAGTADAAEWFSVFFEQQILVRYSPDGFPDDTIANGPTIISTASLDAVTEWFPGITTDETRLRFRTTLEIGGVPAFWEDQLFGEEERSVVRFRIGEVNFEGSNPCARCPVPPRNPYTGEDWPGFQKRFTELRRAHLPAWSHAARFDHFYRLATNTRVASSEHGKPLRVGDLFSS